MPGAGVVYGSSDRCAAPSQRRAVQSFLEEGAVGLHCESAWQACETVETAPETVGRRAKP